MANDFGVGANYSGNFFESMFGSASTSGSGFLGDYAAIKNGSYKKLLKSYYAEEKANASDEADGAKDEKAVKEKKNLMLVKNDAEGLLKAASELFKTEFDIKEEGFDKDDVKKKIQGFVEAYNKVVESGADVDNNSVLSKTLQLTQYVKSNANSLQKVGIHIGSDNKLSFNEKSIDEINKSALNSVFNGRNSVLGNIGNKASQLFNLAGAATYEKTVASAYTKNGQYNPVSAYSMFNVKF